MALKLLTILSTIRLRKLCLMLFSCTLSIWTLIFATEYPESSLDRIAMRGDRGGLGRGQGPRAAGHGLLAALAVPDAHGLALDLASRAAGRSAPPFARGASRER